MRQWLGTAIVLVSLLSFLSAQTISNGFVRVIAVGERGRYWGFAVQPLTCREPIATVRFGSLDNISQLPPNLAGKERCKFCGLAN